MQSNEKKVRFGFDLGGTKVQPYAEYEDGTKLLDDIIWEENKHYIDKEKDTVEEKKRKITSVMINQLEKYIGMANITVEQIMFIGITVPRTRSK